MPTTGYITVTFNATYLGDYRICWRDDSVGPYTCFLASCSALGTCTVYINPISFDTNTCDQIIYNGYVQAACEDPDTTEGAVFWNVVYTPVTDCVPYEVTCLGVTTLAGFSINITAQGFLAFLPTSNLLECICTEFGDPLWPKLNVSSGQFNQGDNCQPYNTNLLISPYGTTELDLQAFDTVTQTSGNFHWTPGTLFCGIFKGSSALSTQISDVSCDPCGFENGIPYPNSGGIGNLCIVKPIVSISPPPPGGTQATAEAVISLGGITNNTPITINNPGSGGTDGIYYAWNEAGINASLIVGSNPRPRGQNYFKVEVVGGKVVNITPCNSYQCQPGGSQHNYRGYYWNDLQESFRFIPSNIGGVQGAVFTKPSGATTTDLGQIVKINITNPGSGYLATPSVSLIIPATCSNALPVTIPQITTSSTPGGVGPCPPFIPGDGCGTYPGNVYPTIPALPVGSTFTLCYPYGTVNPPWTITDAYDVNSNPAGCCYDCVSLLVEPSPANPNPTITYTNCDTSNVTVITINSNQIISCAVNNSWVSTFTDTSFTVLGPCTS